MESLSKRLLDEIKGFTTGSGDAKSLDKAIATAHELLEKLYILRYKSYEAGIFKETPNEIPEFDFSIISVIPSVKFHKIIKDLNVVHDMIEIRSVNGVMSFSGKGEQSQGQVILTEGEKDENLKFKKKDDSVYQGRFSLKNMMILYKCTSLCSNVELYLENDTPLFIKYNIGRLGYTYLILAPVVEDVTKLENDIQVEDEEDEEN